MQDALDIKILELRIAIERLAAYVAATRGGAARARPGGPVPAPAGAEPL
jgi:hypothetical protein